MRSLSHWTVLGSQAVHLGLLSSALSFISASWPLHFLPPFLPPSFLSFFYTASCPGTCHIDQVVLELPEIPLPLPPPPPAPFLFLETLETSVSLSLKTKWTQHFSSLP